MRNTVFILLFSILTTALYGQQEQLYTQFMFNKQVINPAYAGTEKNLCLSFTHRDQWIGLDGAPKSQALSVSLPVYNNKIGLGLNVTKHSIGITDELTLEAIYAYKFKIGNGMLSMGASASTRKYTVDFTDSRLHATDGFDLDPSVTLSKDTKQILNFGFGLYFNTRLYYFGVSIPRLGQADVDFDENDFFSNEVRHLNAMVGGAFAVSDRVTLKPQGLFRIAENAPFDLDLNLSMTIDKKFTIGATYRAGGDQASIGESLDAIFAIQFTPRLMLGFAYDYTLSKLRNHTSGSIEATVHYCFRKGVVQEEIINPRYF